MEFIFNAVYIWFQTVITMSQFFLSIFNEWPEHLKFDKAHLYNYGRSIDNYISTSKKDSNCSNTMFYLNYLHSSLRFCIVQSPTRILNNLVNAINFIYQPCLSKTKLQQHFFITVAQVILLDSSNERNMLYVCFGYLWLDIVLSFIQYLTHLVMYITDNGCLPHS